MSEYQYYEFQALDQPLTAAAQKDISRLSSRVHLTSRSASFVYNYSDFPGDPYKILVQYFDAMLYITNWGSRQLMFRFPASMIPPAIQEQYQYAESLSWSRVGEYLILNIEFNDESGDSSGWAEGEGLLDGLVQLRDDILHGDWRALYLAWLKIAHYEMDMLEDDETLTEPPVPPNLQQLSPALQHFIEFFDLDQDLVAAAAQASPGTQPGDKNLSAKLGLLSDDEKQNFLARLLRGEAHLALTLTQRLRELSAAHEQPTLPAPEKRTIHTLITLVENVTKARLEKERQQTAAARLKHLEKIAQQEQTLWARIPALIEQKQANTYDEAVRILKDLSDLAKHQDRHAEFQAKIGAIREQFPTLHGLHKRLKDARLD